MKIQVLNKFQYFVEIFSDISKNPNYCLPNGGYQLDSRHIDIKVEGKFSDIFFALFVVTFISQNWNEKLQKKLFVTCYNKHDKNVIIAGVAQVISIVDFSDSKQYLWSTV